MATNEQMIGRTDINDLEAILAITNTDVDAVVHEVRSNYDTIFTWDYEKGARPKLNRLYEKAKTSMWNGETDLPWDTPVDQEAVVMANAVSQGGLDAGMDLTGTPFEKWADKEWIQFGVESQNWTLSQFMHGEQGALICTAQIVETVPWIDAKYYAATQVMDEARHVEVFAKYLDTKLSGHYPINAHLRLLLDDIISDSRWDMTYLGMQIMVEGLALAAFGFIHQLTTEPLLKQLLRYVMTDEARHVAFGVLSLQDYYQELSQRRDPRAPGVRLRGGGAHARPVPAAGGVGPAWACRSRRSSSWSLQAPDRALFQQMLFSKIVPNCKKLGLLDAGDGWLRQKFTELGVIQFEDWADTGEEYEMFAAGRTARRRQLPERLDRGAAGRQVGSRGHGPSVRPVVVRLARPAAEGLRRGRRRGRDDRAARRRRRPAPGRGRRGRTGAAAAKAGSPAGPSPPTAGPVTPRCSRPTTDASGARRRPGHGLRRASGDLNDRSQAAVHRLAAAHRRRRARWPTTTPTPTTTQAVIGRLRRFDDEAQPICADARRRARALGAATGPRLGGGPAPAARRATATGSPSR